MSHSMRGKKRGKGHGSRCTIVSLLRLSFSFLKKLFSDMEDIWRVYRSLVLARCARGARSSRELTSRKFFSVSGVGAWLEGKPKLYLRECLGARSSSALLPESVSSLLMERNFFKGILVVRTEIVGRKTDVLFVFRLSHVSKSERIYFSRV